MWTTTEGYCIARTWSDAHGTQAQVPATQPRLGKEGQETSQGTGIRASTTLTHANIHTQTRAGQTGAKRTKIIDANLKHAQQTCSSVSDKHHCPLPGALQSRGQLRMVIESCRHFLVLTRPACISSRTHPLDGGEPDIHLSLSLRELDNLPQGNQES